MTTVLHTENSALILHDLDDDIMALVKQSFEKHSDMNS